MTNHLLWHTHALRSSAFGEQERKMRAAFWAKSVMLIGITVILTGCSLGSLLKPDPKTWLRENKRKIEPLKPKQVPPRPYSEPTLTHLAATPPLRFFEFSENKLVSITWNLSDWDRAILDGDIQRTLNKQSSEPFQWVSQANSENTATLKAGTSFISQREVRVRRLHILSRTPLQITPKTGTWRSWHGALLRSAPIQHPSKVIGRLAPGTKTRIIGEVSGLNGSRWALIAHEGIGIGYVPVKDLTADKGKLSRIHGSAPSFKRPVNLDFAPTLVDRVKAPVLCRKFSVDQMRTDACQGLDGRWRAI